MMTKAKTVKWAQANNVKFVFSRIDGLGKQVFFATNDDRSMDAGMTLVWSL